MKTLNDYIEDAYYLKLNIVENGSFIKDLRKLLSIRTGRSSPVHTVALKDLLRSLAQDLNEMADKVESSSDIVDSIVTCYRMTSKALVLARLMDYMHNSLVARNIGAQKLDEVIGPIDNPNDITIGKSLELRDFIQSYIDLNIYQVQGSDVLASIQMHINANKKG